MRRLLVGQIFFGVGGCSRRCGRREDFQEGETTSVFAFPVLCLEEYEGDTTASLSISQPAGGSGMNSKVAACAKYIHVSERHYFVSTLKSALCFLPLFAPIFQVKSQIKPTVTSQRGLRWSSCCSVVARCSKARRRPQT